MKLPILCSVIIIGLVLGCAAMADEKSWVLLEGEQAALLIHQCSRESPEAIQDVWMPAPLDIEKIEAQLSSIMQLISTQCCGVGGRVDDISRYRRQYAGFIIENRKLIYINAFSKLSNHSDWREQPVMVCEGGRDYWGALYDPATGIFFDLAFNAKNESDERQ